MEKRNLDKSTGLIGGTSRDIPRVTFPYFSLLLVERREGTIIDFRFSRLLAFHPLSPPLPPPPF